MPSSVISEIYYENEKKLLRIFYVSGAIYDYENVPREVYTALKTSKTKGVYLNQHIKKIYSFRKIQ